MIYPCSMRTQTKQKKQRIKLRICHGHRARITRTNEHKTMRAKTELQPR